MKRDDRKAAPLALALALSAAGCGGDGRQPPPSTYAIAGVVSGEAVAGVSVTLAGASRATTTTAADGSYAFPGLANGSYTVTPTLAGYDFSPASRSVTVRGADVAGPDFTSTATPAPAFTIRGAVSGAVSSGVFVALGGDASDVTMTAVDGTYRFPGLLDGSYTVTPSLAGHDFDPVSLDVTVGGADVAGQDFTSTPTAPPTFAIGGTVSGDAVEGVSVALVGPSSATATTAADGTYGFAGLEPGVYTVTPGLEGHAFTPERHLVVVAGADVGGVDFAGALVRYAIRGTVSGVAAGVRVALGGDASAVTTTGGGGAFGFPGLLPGAYTVTPELDGWAFAPPSAAIVLTNADVEGLGFAGALVTWAIAGTVSGDAAAGVTVALAGATSAFTTTDGSGSYRFGGLADGDYTVTASLHGHDFDPPSRHVTVRGADVAGQDFTSTEDPDRDGDGVPNAQDSFPDDPSRFAGYEVVLLDRLGGGRFGAAVAVSGGGEVVGLSEDAGGDLKAVTWAVTDGVASAPLRLDPLGAERYSAAYGVADDGLVVGESARGNDVVAVAWPAGSVTPIALSLAGFEPPAAAYGVAGGRIVGEAFAGGEGVAVLWNGLGADPVELGRVGLASSAAYAISAAGLVVGEGVVAATGEPRGVLWVLDAAGVPGPPVLLPPLSGHVAGIALGVSAAGEIAGESESASGELHAVLWRLAGGVPGPPVDLGIGTASAVNGSSRVVGSTGSPARARAWDARNPSLADPIASGPFGASQAYGLDESNVAVGRADDRGFVAIPR